MGESAAAAKRRTRRIPDELRKRSAQSCDLCRKRRCKCVTEPNGVDCVACKGQGLSCTFTLPRKTRFYGSLEDLSDRYKCLDAIVRAAFPNHAVATASDLIKLGQHLNIEIPDLSAEEPDSFDTLLKDRLKSTDESSVIGTQPGRRKSVDSGFDTGRETDGHHDDSLGKKEDPAFQDQKVALLRDTSGHEHYIGPSGSLQFLDQLRRLLISRDSEISTTGNGHTTSDGRGPTVSQVIDDGARFNGVSQTTNGGITERQEVAQVEDSLSPQAPSASTSGLARTDEIHDLLDQVPKREIVESLLPLYWANVHDDFPLFHRETFEKEYQSFLGNLGQPVSYPLASGVARPDHGWIGCLHMMVVFGSLSSAGHRDDVGSKALQKYCVDATRNLLPRIVTNCSLSGVQALLLLSLFLHNDNERNTAWNLVGTATRICFALGLHRTDTAEIFSPVEREIRKRVFCTLYGFEQFLASSLGRPSGVNDIDVQVVHPRGGILSGRQHSDDALAIMTLKLNQILSTSRNPRYASASTAQAPHEAHQLSVEEVLASLKAWKLELSSLQSLDVPVLAEKDDKLPVPTGSRMEAGELKTLLGWRDLPTVREILLLYLQYHYIYILVTRPFLLRSITASVKTARTPEYGPSPAKTTTNKIGQFSDLCFRHACQMARLLLLLDSFGLIHGASGLDVFFAYSAAMVLILRSLRLDAQEEGLGTKTEHMSNGGGMGVNHNLKTAKQVDEKSLLGALRDLIVRLRELVLKVPKSSTMERFARAMVTFEESAYHVKVKAEPDDSERDPGSSMGQHHYGSHFSGPNLLFRGLMDASYGPTPASDVLGMDQPMQNGAPGMMHGQQHQFLGNGWAVPPSAMGTYGNQPNGLTSFDYLPGLNPWGVGGDQNAQQGTEMPIYGWEDLESMLGNGRSQPRKF
ncbi:hypothetical protein KVR01_013007 [Diaporthe batatas]|uniref:uncharacterized protein n=1 Tax=Diaporthe batatas TaxID=748121 RepID=UPI001D03A555|nr:uncharacterized protein KVR01_013007 [Diaporthe batatas]KAG8157017.1 hypothetical protein KVR01_013007 [Diaporthe batatas]